MTSEKERTNGKYMCGCWLFQCSNTPSDRVSLFKFPSDATLRRQWEKQVQRTRAEWKATDHSYLCSDHFNEDCFEVDSALASQFGIKKRKRLRPGVVPTIFHRQSSELMHEDQPSTLQALKRTADSNPKAKNTVCKRKKGAVEKRETRGEVAIRPVE